MTRGAAQSARDDSISDTGEAIDDEQAIARRRRWPRLLVVLLTGLALAIAGLWIARRPIATGFVDRELTARGVPARYTIESVGLARQRLTNVVLGDPANPDLVADWIEVATNVGLSGASVSGIRAGRVRMRAAVIDGKLSLGSLDRLLPPSTPGQPFALPALDARFGDVRIRLTTPQGLVGVKLSGRGQLNDGFRGQVALVAPTLAVAGCTARDAGGAFAVRIIDARPALDGPVRVARIACGETVATAMRADLNVTLGAALDRWQGRVRLAGERVATPGLAARGLGGTATFAGTARATTGNVTLAAAALGVPGSVAVNGARVAGDYRVEGAGLRFTGRVGADRAVADAGLRRQIAEIATSANATPLGPIARQLAGALGNMARGSTLAAGVVAEMRGAEGALRVTDLALAARSGARITLAGEGIRFGWPARGLSANGIVTTGGGGLPMMRIALRQPAPGAAITGTAIVEPYAAGNARLALLPLRFRLDPSGAGTLTTRATLSGPLAGGRIDGLALQIAARWSAGGDIALGDGGCTAVAWQRLAVSGLVLNPQRLSLCPTGGALVRVTGGRLGGGARLGATRLTGRLGSSPLEIAFVGGSAGLADQSFAMSGVTTRLGVPDRLTWIDVATLNGKFGGGQVAGSFAGGAGQIGNVPLLLSDAVGRWGFGDGRLTVSGGLQVADAQVDAPRFKPLTSDDVALTLVGNAIDATGTLRTPRDRSVVANVVIAHDLGAGTGKAALDVAGIVFADKGLQPDDLTAITYGVIAAVKGRVTGRGDIAWTSDGVTSTGRFATAGTDLAAAFGPVTGLSGEIVFSDLLGLKTAPGQVATVATINPGIAVENGTIRYQLVGEQRVQVESGRWPFAGGSLTLDPTLLDFNADQARQMTFRVVGADAGGFLQQFDFDNLSATGTFDGVLPMIFDQKGGRIEDGRLAARSGGSLAYIGTLTQEDVGFWGNLAFQALKALEYRQLNITMNGPLAGEMVTEIRFAGVSQGKGTKSNFIIRRLARLPFVFNITVRAPFRQLIDSVQSFYDPKRLIERNLPALLEEREKRALPPPAPPSPIQPAESEKLP